MQQLAALVAQAAAAPDPLWCPRAFAARSERNRAARPWRAGALIHNFGQAARAGVSARARGARASGAICRLRGGLCALPPGAAGLGQVAQADPYALGSAGVCTHPGAGSLPGAASGLKIPTHRRSGVLQSRATAIGCARGCARPMDVARHQGLTRRRRQERRLSAGLSTPDRPSLASKRKKRRGLTRSEKTSHNLRLRWALTRTAKNSAAERQAL